MLATVAWARLLYERRACIWLTCTAGDTAFAAYPDGSVTHYSCFHARPSTQQPFSDGSPMAASASSSSRGQAAAASPASTSQPSSEATLPSGRALPPLQSPVAAVSFGASNVTGGGSSAGSSGGTVFGSSSPAPSTPVGGRSGKKGRVPVVVTAASAFDNQGAEWDIARAKSRVKLGKPAAR